MDDMIKKAINALQNSMCNEIELTDSSGLKVRVVKNIPIVYCYYTPSTYQPYQYSIQYPAQQY